jgi:hypothetical protein
MVVNAPPAGEHNHQRRPTAGSGTDASMMTDSDERVKRDDLAPGKRLHIIADLLASGIRRQRADSRRLGEASMQSESERDRLELSEPAALDGPRG